MARKRKAGIPSATVFAIPLGFESDGHGQCREIGTWVCYGQVYDVLKGRLLDDDPCCGGIRKRQYVVEK